MLLMGSTTPPSEVIIATNQWKVSVDTTNMFVVTNLEENSSIALKKRAKCCSLQWAVWWAVLM